MAPLPSRFPTHVWPDAAADRRAQRFFMWRDHGVLRTFWTNFDQIAPGVFRSNHPDHRRLTDYKTRGITSVLNLRGANTNIPYVYEAASCAALGMTLESVALRARSAADRQEMLNLFAVFDRIERPFVMHCKSGADRAGLASALYLLDQGQPVAKARAQLSWRYLHLRFTKTGIQDHMLDLFAASHAQTGIGVRDWIAKEYDPISLAQSFATKRILPL